MGYGQAIENVIKDYLDKQSTLMKVQKENLRIIINPKSEILNIHLYHKGDLVKKVTIDEIISQ